MLLRLCTGLSSRGLPMRDLPAARELRWSPDECHAGTIPIYPLVLPHIDCHFDQPSCRPVHRHLDHLALYRRSVRCSIYRPRESRIRGYFAGWSHQHTTWCRLEKTRVHSDLPDPLSAVEVDRLERCERRL